MAPPVQRGQRAAVTAPAAARRAARPRVLAPGTRVGPTAGHGAAEPSALSLLRSAPLPDPRAGGMSGGGPLAAEIWSVWLESVPAASAAHVALAQHPQRAQRAQHPQCAAPTACTAPTVCTALTVCSTHSVHSVHSTPSISFAASQLRFPLRLLGYFEIKAVLLQPSESQCWN